MIRWYGWGILALPVMIFCLLGCAFGGTLLLWDIAAQGDNGIDHGGVPLGSMAVGLVVGGLLNHALGLALNSRRMADGTRVRTNRHGLGHDIALERFGRGQAVLGILALPLSAVQFVSAPIVWTLIIAWAVIVVTVLVAVSRRRGDSGATQRP
ncbi:hypothetical protein ACIP2X_07415 [Streptomyces sp. NPDC089424]|uniref:hypothetical protein n=1 Tax=Streptomyces sp. NPDC089424 TaxID=3365917 RepID=UPI003818BF3E